jgi:hypothetical protein
MKKQDVSVILGMTKGTHSFVHYWYVGVLGVALTFSENHCNTAATKRTTAGHDDRMK